jgi:adhesin HecA-like repeat protein
VDAAGVSAREDIIGQITTLTVTPMTGPATTSVSTGSLDINNSGGLGATQTLALSAGSLTAGNRATLTLTSGSTTRNYVLYFVSQTQFFVMDANSSPATVAIGSLYQQF